MKNQVFEMSFEELYRLVHNGKRLREFVIKESAARRSSPSEILFLVIRIYKEKAKEMAMRN